MSQLRFAVRSLIGWSLLFAAISVVSACGLKRDLSRPSEVKRERLENEQAR